MIFLRVPASLTYRSLVMRTITAACDVTLNERPGITSDQLQTFTNEAVSAVGEAFNNVVIHGYQGREIKDVTMSIKTVGDQLAIEITDQGHVFHPADAPEPDLSSLPESGMGMFIIRAFVDELDYQPGPPNVLRMLKRFP